ncbi:hypothetical protein FAVG1_12834 [Fusarium avenaceum]|nr:hypothetical protein FAVG1_12834 [Fusarium avenaceum]
MPPGPSTTERIPPESSVTTPPIPSRYLKLSSRVHVNLRRVWRVYRQWPMEFLGDHEPIHFAQNLAEKLAQAVTKADENHLGVEELMEVIKKHNPGHISFKGCEQVVRELGGLANRDSQAPLPSLESSPNQSPHQSRKRQRDSPEHTPASLSLLPSIRRSSRKKPRVLENLDYDSLSHEEADEQGPVQKVDGLAPEENQEAMILDNDAEDLNHSIQEEIPTNEAESPSASDLLIQLKEEYREQDIKRSVLNGSRDQLRNAIKHCADTSAEHHNAIKAILLLNEVMAIQGSKLPDKLNDVFEAARANLTIAKEVFQKAKDSLSKQEEKVQRDEEAKQHVVARMHALIGEINELKDKLINATLGNG